MERTDMGYLEEKARVACNKVPKPDVDLQRAMDMYQVTAAEVTSEMKSTAATLNYIDVMGGIYGS